MCSPLIIPQSPRLSSKLQVCYTHRGTNPPPPFFAPANRQILMQTTFNSVHQSNTCVSYRATHYLVHTQKRERFGSCTESENMEHYLQILMMTLACYYASDDVRPPRDYQVCLMNHHIPPLVLPTGSKRSSGTPGTGSTERKGEERRAKDIRFNRRGMSRNLTLPPPGLPNSLIQPGPRLFIYRGLRHWDPPATHASLVSRKGALRYSSY